MLKSFIAFLGLCFTVTTGLSDMVYAQNATSEQVLDARQQSIIPIAAFTAKGDVENLRQLLPKGCKTA